MLAARKWSARDELHVQGCLSLSQVGLLFPVNHAPCVLVYSSISDSLLDTGITEEESKESFAANPPKYPQQRDSHEALRRRIQGRL